ncbi:HAMP domain-containing histidine kinase [bacterium]|nr:MAG: HAMP domain-containing histidine kinase [bacterium]
MKYSPRSSLRRFLILWSGAISLAFILLALDAGAALHRLSTVGQDEARDVTRLQLLQEFEVAALEANRDPGQNKWQRADAALQRLRESNSHDPSLAPIVSSYRHLKDEFDPQTPWGDEREFLDAFRNFRRMEVERIQSDSLQNGQFDRLSRIAIIVLSGVAVIGLGAGGVKLWTRVFEPTLAISDAARRFGQGDLAARVEVEYDDELGELGNTFNDMASAVQTREAERLRFVAAVAHDLKNPLVVIGGVAYMLRDKPHKLSCDEQSDWLDKIARNSKRMEAMILDLTDAVQAQTGALKLRPGKCDIARVMREGVEETGIAFPHHIVCYDGSDLLELRGDKARLERVVGNLLSNAAKYSARGTTVTAHLEQNASQAIIEVHDQGAGISPEDLKRLFTPFVRLEHTEKMASGTGLGLATVKKIVEAHGGRLEVESELGKGSTFRVFLPIELPEN